MNVTQATKLTVNQIDDDYLAILNSGIMTESTRNYFNEFISVVEIEASFSAF